MIAGIIILQGLPSCKSNGNTSGQNVQFFDLKKYFNDESVRLTKLNPLINKTAARDKNSETKKLHIADWGTELNVFSESDINKPAWKTRYKTSNSEGIITYTAIDSSLKTQYIIIKKQQDKVTLILVFNHTKTTLFGKVLYETRENLSYVPDSIYRVQKRQYFRTRGFTNYYIKGLFN